MSTRTLPVRATASRATATLTIPAQRERVKVALYLRLSVADLEDGDRDVSAGIDRQRSDVLALAHRHGLFADPVVRLHTDPDAGTADAVVYVEDGESAWKRRKVTIQDQHGETRKAWRVVRPVFAQMMRDLRSGLFASAIVYNSDRVARDPYDVEDIIETAEHHGVTWHAATGSLDLATDDGRTMLRIMTAVAHKASADTARRVARAHRQRVETGIPAWNARPFGHGVVKLGDGEQLREDEQGWRGKDGVMRVARIVPDEAECIRHAADRIIRGAFLADVVRSWADVPTTLGGAWGTRTVGQMLRQARLAGLIEHKGETVGASEFIPAILTEATWRAMVAKLDRANGAGLDGGRKRANGSRRTASLSGGIATCGACGAGMAQAWMRVRWNAPDKGAKRRMYACNGQGCTSIAADIVDREVTGRLTIAAGLYGMSIVPADTVDAEPLRERERDLMARLTEVEDAIADGSMPVRSGLAIVQRLTGDLDAVRAEIREAESGSRDRLDPDQLAAVLKDFNGRDLGERRQVIRTMYASIRILRREEGQSQDGERVVTRFADGTLPADADPTIAGDVVGAAWIADFDGDGSGAGSAALWMAAR